MRDAGGSTRTLAQEGNRWEKIGTHMADICDNVGVVLLEAWNQL